MHSLKYIKYLIINPLFVEQKKNEDGFENLRKKAQFLKSIRDLYRNPKLFLARE